MFNEFLAIPKSEELQQQRLKDAEDFKLYKEASHKNYKVSSWVLLLIIIFLITTLVSY